MDWRLRKAEKKDEKRIRELFIEMLQTIYQKEDVQGYQEGDLDRFFAGHGDWICIAEVSGTVAAFLSIEEHHEQIGDYLYLDDFCVDSAYRGNGIGSDMLCAAQRYAEDKGIPMIVLHVEESNESARRLYERFGFRVLDQKGSRYRMIKE